MLLLLSSMLYVHQVGSFFWMGVMPAPRRPAKQTEIFVISSSGVISADIENPLLTTKEMIIMIRLGEHPDVEEHLAVQSLLAAVKRLREATCEN